MKNTLLEEMPVETSLSKKTERAKTQFLVDVTDPRLKRVLLQVTDLDSTAEQVEFTAAQEEQVNAVFCLLRARQSLTPEMEEHWERWQESARLTVRKLMKLRERPSSGNDFSVERSDEVDRVVVSLEQDNTEKYWQQWEALQAKD